MYTIWYTSYFKPDHIVQWISERSKIWIKIVEHALQCVETYKHPNLCQYFMSFMYQICKKFDMNFDIYDRFLTEDFNDKPAGTMWRWDGEKWVSVNDVDEEHFTTDLERNGFGDFIISVEQPENLEPEIIWGRIDFTGS